MGEISRQDYGKQTGVRFNLFQRAYEYHEMVEHGAEYHSGPIYRWINPQGRELIIQSAVFRTDEDSYDAVFIPTIDGQIGGIRQIELKWHKGEIRGSIWTELRGQGIATILELCVMDFVQKEVNKRHESITWKRSDANDGIYINDEERQRWLKLYGPNNILGLNEKGSRLFMPTNEPDPEFIKRNIRVEHENRSEGKAETVEHVLARLVRDWE